jgi:RNA polymerase sigma-70 factor (ECF subfamily)
MSLVSRESEQEARLIERLARHDERAFGELYRAYGRRVHGLVFRMLGSHTEAEDLTQQIFLQVFKSIGTFRGDSKLSTWMYRIAINLCKNRVKYLKVRHSGEEDELEDAFERVPMGEARRANANIGQIDRPDEALAGKQVELIVRRAIAALEPNFRECLILRDVEELSYEEIAEITGLNLGTVKSRIFRARTMLREAVEKATGEKLA